MDFCPSGYAATGKVLKSEVIAEFSGETHKAPRATQLPAQMVNHAIQTGPDEYVYGRRWLAELLDHSCTPNTGIQGKTMLAACRDIAPEKNSVETIGVMKIPTGSSTSAIATLGVAMAKSAVFPASPQLSRKNTSVLE